MVDEGSTRTLELSSHPGYHRPGLPRLERINLRQVDRDEQLDGLFVAGDVDVREGPRADAEEGTAGTRGNGRPGARMQTRPSRTVRALGLSLLGSKGGADVRFVPAFQDERVRRAVGHALDRDALLAVDGSTLAGPVGPAHRGDALVERELRTFAAYRHDPATAQALLAAAGASGLPFTIDVPDRAPLLALGRLIADQLRAAGFAPSARVRPMEEVAAATEAGDFEAIVTELGPHNTADRELRLHTSAGVDGGFSPWGYSNPVYDAAVREALSAPDPAERAERARAAQRLLLNDRPALLPIGAPTEVALVASEVSGYEFGAYEFNSAWLSARWEVTAVGPATP